MSFFCSFLDHPGSHLDQVYDSPLAYFWCANPGVVEGTLAVMVGASAEPCRAEQQAACPPFTVSFAASDAPGDGSKGFYTPVGSDSL